MKSARIKRRNKCGFSGFGNYSWMKLTLFGDYTNEVDNHKDIDRKNTIAHKQRCGFFSGFRTRCMSKKYADNHQK